MNAPLTIDMIEATRLTREGRLEEAMAVIRGALEGPPLPGASTGFPGGGRVGSAQPAPRIIDMTPPPAATGGAWTAPRSGEARAPGLRVGAGKPRAPADRLGFPNRMGRFTQAEGRPGLAWPASRPAAGPVPPGARFEERAFANVAGRRAYKLYIPSGYAGRAAPLVVMLHGCTQSPDDFAAGTRMNRLAQEHGFLVAYPAQCASANASKCWNWFSPGDQRREEGEPSLIAGITLQVIGEFAVDRGRVYVAGLSAGGAAAVVLGAAYPDLYAAVGVHSGLALGAAGDLPSALAAMRRGGPPAAWKPDRRGGSGAAVATIVFHGDRDTVVNPLNGDQVIAQSKAAATLKTTTSRGQAPGGIRYTRTVQADESGRPMLEHWALHGAGHAWSGGSLAGSYTEPRGPDASREMIRFFFQHTNRVARAGCGARADVMPIGCRASLPPLG